MLLMDFSSLQLHALRLHPGNDLKQSLQTFATEKKIKAGFILTCVGSLQKASLRYAGQNEAVVREGRFEIVSLVGTLSLHGAHLHISVADESGITIGGHLLDNNLVYTTAEVLIGEIPGMEFKREIDGETGYKELQIV